MAKIYISCSGDDLHRREGFIGMMENPNNDFIDDPVRDRKDMRGEPKEEIRQYINSYLQQCSGLILLLGNNTHRRPVVDYELDVMQSKKIPIIVIKLPETIGGLPKRLQSTMTKNDILPYKASDIQDAIDKKFGRN